MTDINLFLFQTRKEYNIISNKLLCILVPAPLFLHLGTYLHKFSSVKYISAENGASIHGKFALYLVQIKIIINKTDANTAPLKCVKI